MFKLKYKKLCDITYDYVAKKDSFNICKITLHYSKIGKTGSLYY